MQKTVLKVLTTIAKFVGHCLRKEAQSKVVVAEVPALGQFVCSRPGGASGSEKQACYEFIPSY